MEENNQRNKVLRDLDFFSHTSLLSRSYANVDGRRNRKRGGGGQHEVLQPVSASAKSSLVVYWGHGTFGQVYEG